MPYLRHVRTQQEPLETTIARLETYVARMEKRYECRSDEFVQCVETQKVRETAETGSWLSAYRMLVQLKNSAGHGTGMSTPTIK